MEWVNHSFTALEPFSAKATYINYLSVDDPAAVQASYGAHYARLARIKSRYDPSNFFHRNRNIRMLN
jgi:FAD/FMN-containing dehydrogenase